MNEQEGEAVCRQRPPTSDVDNLARGYLALVIRAQAPDGRCHNRLNPRGRWEDRRDTGDWCGRAVWALGTAAARGPCGVVLAETRWADGLALTSPTPMRGSHCPKTLSSVPLTACARTFVV